MPFNKMLDHQKSRCRSGKTNKIIDTTFERMHSETIPQLRNLVHLTVK